MACNWTWNPTPVQRKEFDEWKGYAIGYLVSCKEGVNIGSIPKLLEEHTGESIPLMKMGFRTINQFLYEMSDVVEVRTFNGKLFVFIRENGVPDNLWDIRNMVLGQAKDKGSKIRGVVRRPTKNQASYVHPEALLEAVKHIINRPAPIGSYSSTQQSTFNSRGASNFRGASSSSRGQTASRPSYPYQRPTASSSRPTTGTYASQAIPSNSRNFMSQQQSVLRPNTSLNTSSGSSSSMQSSSNGWDFSSTSMNRGNTSLPKPSTSQPSRFVSRRLQGLIEDDDESENYDSSDDEKYDYYAGPRLAELHSKSRQAAAGVSVKIANPSAIIHPKPKPSPSTTSEQKPITSSIQRETPAPLVMEATKMPSLIDGDQVDSLVAGLRSSQQHSPNPSAPIEKSDGGAKKKLPESESNESGDNSAEGKIEEQEVQNNSVSTTLDNIPNDTSNEKRMEEIPVTIPEPKRVICLDREYIFGQGTLNFLQYQSLFYTIFQDPQINFPKFRIGSTVYAQCSLKNYLDSMGSSAYISSA